MRKKITAVLSLIAAFTVSLFGLSACMGGTNSSSSSGSVERPFESESTPGDGSTSDDGSTPDGGNSSGGDNSSDEGSIPDDGSSPGDENPVPSISLDKETLSINAYTSETLTATLTNSEEIIDWTSSNEEVAKVIDGKVIAVGVAFVTDYKRQLVFSEVSDENTVFNNRNRNRYVCNFFTVEIRFYRNSLRAVI